MKASGLLHHCCTAVHAWIVLLTFRCAKLFRCYRLTFCACWEPRARSEDCLVHSRCMWLAERWQVALCRASCVLTEVVMVLHVGDAGCLAEHVLPG